MGQIVILWLLSISFQLCKYKKHWNSLKVQYYSGFAVIIMELLWVPWGGTDRERRAGLECNLDLTTNSGVLWGNCWDFAQCVTKARFLLQCQPSSAPLNPSLLGVHASEIMRVNSSSCGSPRGEATQWSVHIWKGVDGVIAPVGKKALALFSIGAQCDSNSWKVYSLPKFNRWHNIII